MDDLFSKLNKEVNSRFGKQSGNDELSTAFSTGEYKTFKVEEFKIHTLWFERYVLFSKSIFSFAKLGKKASDRMKEQLEIAGYDITPDDVFAGFLMAIAASIAFSVPMYLFGWNDFMYFILLTGMFIAYQIYSYPEFIAEITRIRAQQESLLAIVYMTIYLRVNPVFENAIYFATKHLSGPLGKDLKTILWMLESEKISTIEQGIELMVPLWIKRNNDFVEAIMILKNAVDQPTEEEQARILDKALSTILTSTYNKMKEYAHSMTTPVTILYTFGIMLPLIGLIAFPMMSIFMADSININYLFFGYIVVLPAAIFFFSRRVLSKRPGAFSFPDLTGNPFVPPKGKYLFTFKGKNYLVTVWPVAVAVGTIIAIPGLWHLFMQTIPLFLKSLSCKANALDAAACIPSSEYTVGAMFVLMLIPLGAAVGTMLFFYGRSIQKLNIRDKIVEIEDDLSGGLFRLSNEFSEKIPIESAIDNFIRQYKLLNLEKKSMFVFFSETLDKMQNEGVSLRYAIFNSKDGLILLYPSVILKEIMWIIVEGERKGAMVLKNITTKISEYLENTKNVRQVIYDLLIDTVNSMNMEARILAPFIAGLVGSLSLIIIKTLYQMFTKLDSIMKTLMSGGGMMGGASGGSAGFFTDLINFSRITPPTLFVVLVGIYMVEVVVLLSIVANGVEWGFDDVSRDVRIAKNLLVATIVYLGVTIIGTLAFISLVEKGVASVGV